jgi:hypothetical protein
MQITRDVILDLAPLYLTGDASSDTRALVDDYLAADPELARWMDEQRTETFEPLGVTPPVDLETRALLRTRRRIAVQRWLFGIGCYFVALSLTVEYSTRNRRVVEWHFVARDHPMVAVACLAVTAFCWFFYAVMRRRASFV